jgi:hypothetical protein
LGSESFLAWAKADGTNARTAKAQTTVKAEQRIGFFIFFIDEL